MTTAVLVLATLLVTPPPSGPGATADLRQQVEACEQQLMAAVRQGDRPALERMVADGFVFVHATGALDTRRQYIDAVVSAAERHAAPDIERLDWQVEIYDGHTAVATSRAIVHGRGEDVLLRSLHVYVRRGDAWLWAGGQSTRLPTRPRPSAQLSPALREAYSGRYEVGPGRVLTVRVEGETLKALVPGFREAELIPRSETEFAWFNPEVNLDAALVFVRDDAGRVTHAVYRREGQEVWRAPRLP